MKVLQINATCNNGSTGRIMFDLNSIVNDTFNTGYMLYGYYNGKEGNTEYCMNHYPDKYAIRKNLLISRITGRMGYNNELRTRRALKWIDSINPDVIHIHNIHGNWINIGLLFEYINEHNIPFIWTLHDCWAFTGRCSGFESSGCEKWKSGCYKCIDRKIYPQTYFFDFSRKMWIEKKKIFTLSPSDRACIVTPSAWLENYVKQSFLNKYHSVVINNGIRTDIFKPINNLENSFTNKRIILGVASSWNEAKGIRDFVKLNEIIDHDIYTILLVGINDVQKRNLPKEMITVNRTNNIDDLVEIYNNAYVFVNPTYQDNYPTVNLEAISCGVPVITYDTGGSPEMINDITGKVVDRGNIKELYKAIQKLKTDNQTRQLLHQYAVNNFDKGLKYLEYIDLYKNFFKN